MRIIRRNRAKRKRKKGQVWHSANHNEYRSVTTSSKIPSRMMMKKNKRSRYTIWLISLVNSQSCYSPGSKYEPLNPGKWVLSIFQSTHENNNESIQKPIFHDKFTAESTAGTRVQLDHEKFHCATDGRNLPEALFPNRTSDHCPSTTHIIIAKSRIAWSWRCLAIIWFAHTVLHGVRIRGSRSAKISRRTGRYD